MFHLITNIERLETEHFLAVLVFSDDGYLVDACAHLYKGEAHAVNYIHEVLQRHGQSATRIWTSNHALFIALLKEPGLGVELKHRDSTAETGHFIERYRDILIDLYEIEPLTPLPKLPTWRRWLFNMLQKITTKIGGNGKYEI